MYTITHFLVDSSLLLRSLCYKILSRCNTQQHIAQTEVLLHLKGSTAWKKWARPPDGCQHINHACMNTFESTAESNWGFLTTLFSSSDIMREKCATLITFYLSQNIFSIKLNTINFFLMVRSLTA